MVLWNGKTFICIKPRKKNCFPIETFPLDLKNSIILNIFTIFLKDYIYSVYLSRYILSFLEPCSVKSSCCVSTIPSISAYIRLVVVGGRSSVEFAFDVIAEA